jgi:RNA polymerase sigma-70 factor (ECF subfamily)
MPEAREDRFCALYEQTRPRIIAYVLRRTSSPEDAADIVAEVYEIAWRRLDDVPDGHSALLWLYVTARHVAANHGRRTLRQGETTTRLAEELRRAPLRIEPADEEKLAMQSCLASLSPEEREVLMLAGWEGLSASEIGRVLGCSPTAARIRLHRARTRLKSAMAELASLEKRDAASRQERVMDLQKRAIPQEVLEQ